MESFYFDTSALIKLYIEEEGSDRVINLVESLEEGKVFIVDITLLESRSAVRRREREGDVSGMDANRILKQIDEDGSSLYLVQPVNPAVIEEAARLIDAYPLRTYDALQLAGCLTVLPSAPGPVTFACADTRLCEAARLEGLSTLNPIDPAGA